MQANWFINKNFFLLVTIIILNVHHAISQDVAELNSQNKSLSYSEVIKIYSELAQNHEEARFIEAGLTDIGRPLHLFILSNDKTFSPAEAKQKGKAIILINNGIHPGEPDGIDASVQLAQNYLNGKLKLPDNVVVCIVPVFNIDGSLKTGCCTRANQNGPEVQGFRGNAQNLDLNRDFIKCDSENARSLTKIFRTWDPDVFIDTHVSNGADYQYTMTLISTQHNKLGGKVGEFLKKEMTPAIFSMMKNAGHEMSTYVNTTKYDFPPETGIYGFLETPRYASGYASLFNCLAFVPETHMLKPFPQRVEATLKLLEIFVTYTGLNAGKIIQARKNSKDEIISKTEFPISWEVDTTKFELVNFNGYEAVYRESKVTGQQQLYYDRKQPFSKQIKFYDEYTPKQVVKKPSYYIIPQAWKIIISRMELNRIQMTRLSADTVINVESYVIDDFKTGTSAYEGHFVHNSVKLKTETKALQYYKGDYLIPVNQESNRYIVETLEPHAPDSWFAWGFFDAILQQKEWFSAYVFDELAAQILDENPQLKATFLTKKASDKEFSDSAFSQLYFIYKNSPYFEDFRRYPVGKVY